MSSEEKEKNRISRRDFMKAAAIGGAAVVGSGILTGCASGSSTNLPAKWDKEADVVVVGYGGAGAISAIAALDAGAEVIVLEKREVPGGSTAICGGLIYAGGTSVQKEHGIEDSVDKMYQHYINAGKGFNDPDLVRIAVDQSASNIDKLIELGGSFPTAPSVSGAEINVGSEVIARVHGIAYGDLGGGGAYFGVLADGAKAKGAEILMETPAKSLFVNADGEVVGVMAESEGKEIAVKARKGVILTTGGFTRNKEMLKKFTRQGYYCQPLGTPGLDGDGLRMALALGADVAGICEILGIPGLTLPGAVSATYAFWTFFPDMPALLINLNGQRFVDEFAFYDWKCTELLHQPENTCFSVFDDTGLQVGAGRFVMGFSDDLQAEIDSGLVLKGDSLGELAKKMGVPEAKFEETIAKWNADAETGVDSQFGRIAGLSPLATPPFYAFQTFPTSFDNSGGLKINTNAQVVDVWGKPIPRLYAAGQVSGGVIGEHYPGSGTALNAFMTFGRIAGKNAANLEPA